MTARRFSLGVAVLLSALSLTDAAFAGDVRLIDAVRNRDMRAIRTLLRQKVDVNAPQADLSTALHYAAEQDDVETAAVLIEPGVRVGCDKDYGEWPVVRGAT